MLAFAERNTVLHLIAFLDKNGLTDNGKSGLIANLYAESGVRLDNLQNSYEKKWNINELDYFKAVDNGTWKSPIDGLTFAFDHAGVGLAQWTSSGRKKGLLDYSHELGKSITSEEVQFGWLMRELSTSYKNVLAMLKDPNATLEDCAEVVVCKYEKPASVLSEGEAKQNTINRRIGYAKEVYAEFFGESEEKENMSKNIVVAINAGHWIGNPKGVPQGMSVLGGTLEWTLNSRVVDKFVEIAKQYDGITVVQNYDVTGQSKVNNELVDRIRMAEKAKADIYLSIHHNAADVTPNTWAGGGTVVFYYQGNSKNQATATRIYNEIKARTGLKGNRSTPICGTRNYQEINATTMPAFIIECGFMNSTIDVQYIAKPEWPAQIAEGIMAALVKEFGFTKKAILDTPKEEPKEEIKEEPKEEVKEEPKEEVKEEVKAEPNKVTVTVGKVKVTKKTLVYTKSSYASPGVYTITEVEDGMGKLKSGIGWIPLADAKNV